MSGMTNRQHDPQKTDTTPERVSTIPIKGLTAVGRARKKINSPAKGMTRWVLKNQTGISLTLLCLLFASHQLWPRAQSYATKFFTLSYRNSNTGKYAIGFDDFYFIAFVFIILTGLRSALMHHLFQPLARHLGISNQRELNRFAEQSYMLLCYGYFWPMGVYIYHNSVYWRNLHELWTDWPTRDMDGVVKAYYLMQWSFSVQQVVVCNIEQRRKDHRQIMTHHFVTISLISCSYAYHFTRVGNLILVIMDFVDMILPIGKLAKYLGYQKFCDGVFGFFVIAWFATRHVCFMLVCWSVYSDSPGTVSYACFRGSADHLQGPLPLQRGWRWIFEPFLDSQGLICNNKLIMHGFLAFLLSLQVLMVGWSYAIVKMVLRVINGYAVEDTRSDDERGLEGEKEDNDEEGSQGARA